MIRAIPSRPSTRCSPRRSAAPTRSPSATPATWPSSTAPASPRRCTSSATCRRSSAAPAPSRRCTSRPTPPTRSAARSASACRRRRRAIETKLLFFELEWAALDDERADELLATEGLDFCRHHLHTARRYRPHLLCEPEEKILAEKALTARNAWGRLFEEQIAALQVDLEEGAEPVSLEVALSRLHSPDRDVRAHAAERVTAALEPGLRTRGFVFNTLLADKMVDDRLRGYPHWLAEPQPRQRGLRRVGAGAGRPPSATATSCRAAGTG